MSLHPKSFDLEWLSPVDYIEQSHDGEMIHITMSNFDLQVTPEHQMFYQKRWDRRMRRDIWQFTSARDLPVEANLYRSSRWVGKSPCQIKIHDLRIDTKTFCAFMAAYLSDGNYNHRIDSDSRIKISRQASTEQDELYEALVKLPCQISRDDNAVYVKSSPLRKYVESFGYAHEKYVPVEIKSLSSEYLRVFLDWYCFCDGYKMQGKEWAGGKFDDKNIYYTSSKRLADDIGEVILKAGHYPSFRLNEVAGTQHEFRNGTYIINHDLWIIYENTNVRAILSHYSDRVKRVKYAGMVYCIELPRNHTLYVRRNGKCVWCGNCRTDAVGA